MRVLLIDDSSTMRKIQKRVLLGMYPDLEIVEAGNGKEALEKLKEFSNEFDFLLCDINMPEMNGMETLQAIRANPDTVKLPIIMCTSVAEKGQVMEAIKAGATNYLVKPFQPDELEKKISTVIGK